MKDTKEPNWEDRGITQSNIKDIFDILSEIYPVPQCELDYEDPFQLLISTVLAAQATDKKVNEVMAKVFIEYKTAYDFSRLSELEIADKIKSINFYKTKAKYIASICTNLIEKYNGQVPSTRDELITLPGVGRKTANVVLSNAFGTPAIAVDTHVLRVSNRLGLVATEDVLSAELALEKLIPKTLWTKAHNYLVLHGRYSCKAKKPDCEVCKLKSLCPYFDRDK